MADNMITNVKVNLVNGNKTVKGNVKFTVGNVVTVKGAILNGKNGNFVALPRTKYTDKNDGTEKYANDVEFVSRPVGDAIQKLILDEYEKALKGGSTSTAKSTKTASANQTDDVPF